MDKQTSYIKEMVELVFGGYDVGDYLCDFVAKDYDYERSMIKWMPDGVLYTPYLLDLLDYLNIRVESFDQKHMIISDSKFTVRLECVEDYKGRGLCVDFNSLKVEMKKQDQPLEVTA
jgi:hypothetical protein